MFASSICLNDLVTPTSEVPREVISLLDRNISTSNEDKTHFFCFPLQVTCLSGC